MDDDDDDNHGDDGDNDDDVGDGNDDLVYDVNRDADDIDYCDNDNDVAMLEVTRNF